MSKTKLDKYTIPFDVPILDAVAQEVTNPFSGESCMLAPEPMAVYDVIKGAEIFGDYDTMRTGLAWFRQYWPKEYMILLD